MKIMGMEIKGIEQVAEASKNIGKRQSMELYYNIKKGEAFIGNAEPDSPWIMKVTNLIRPNTEEEVARAIARAMMA